MAWIVADGWDYYATNTDVARSVWDSVTTNPNLMGVANTRFSLGQSVRGAANMTKTLSGNEATLYVALAYYHTGALSGTNTEWAVQYRDAGTAQVTVVMESSGNIVLKRGTETGTVVATYTAAFAQDVWTHFQIRVVIDPTAGTFTVRKNGAVTDSFSATGLNTRSTANSYANSLVLYSITGTTNYLDDFLCYSGSGAAPNGWVGDCRAICLAAVSDTAQKNFAASTPGGTNLAGINLLSSSGVGSTNSAANTMTFSPLLTPTRVGQVTKGQQNFSAAPAGSYQMAIYDNLGASGQPGNLLGASAVVVNPPTGLVDFTFTPPVQISMSLKYYLAVNQTVAPSSGAGVTGVNVYKIAQTFASGFPNPAPGMTTSLSNINPTFAVSGTNSAMVSEPLANGDTDYVADATVGDSDLYGVDVLPVTPFAVVGVVTKVYIRKSDAGTRQGQILVKSGATQVAGTDTAVSSTWTYLARVDAVDPATGVAWTQSGVQAMQIGQKVTL